MNSIFNCVLKFTLPALIYSSVIKQTVSPRREISSFWFLIFFNNKTGHPWLSWNLGLCQLSSVHGGCTKIRSWKHFLFTVSSMLEFVSRGRCGDTAGNPARCVFASSWSLGIAGIWEHLAMLCSSQESRACSPSVITQHCPGPSNQLPIALQHIPGMLQAWNPQWYPISFAHQPQFACAQRVVSCQPRQPIKFPAIPVGCKNDPLLSVASLR